MLCLKGKISRKIMVKLIYQEGVMASIKMYKILYYISKTLLIYMAQIITFLNIIVDH